MFNQRPNSLLGLEAGCNAASGELMNLLSPIIYSPDEYFRNYLSQFSAHEVAAVQQQALASPLIQRSIQQAVQQHLNSPQGQLQVPHPAPLPPPPHHHHHYQPPSQPPVPTSTTAPTSAATQASQNPQTTQSSNQVERPSSLPAASRSSKAGALTDEERLRNKRERNRRAAANCRRRKDERLKQLEDENESMRKTVLSFIECLDRKIDEQANPTILKAIIETLRGSIDDQQTLAEKS